MFLFRVPLPQPTHRCSFNFFVTQGQGSVGNEPISTYFVTNHRFIDCPCCCRCQLVYVVLQICSRICDLCLDQVRKPTLRYHTAHRHTSRRVSLCRVALSPQPPSTNTTWCPKMWRKLTNDERGDDKKSLRQPPTFKRMDTLLLLMSTCPPTKAIQVMIAGPTWPRVTSRCYFTHSCNSRSRSTLGSLSLSQTNANKVVALLTMTPIMSMNDRPVYLWYT